MRIDSSATAVICLLGALLGISSSALAETREYRVCTGEYENNCPEHNFFKGCNGDGSAPLIEEVSRNLCVIGTEKGPISYPYEFSGLKVYGGNKCNYSVFTVKCQKAE